ncbi:MAG: general secretion pathway protein GspB [Burkholderiaceae bacterium]|nr:general secretion pathway protein GspB [Burkholderiaceae bacterium]
MSYILEALRKADAERGRGSVPDLHAQALPLSVSDAQVQRPRSSPALWLVLGAGLAALAAAAWYGLGRDEPARMPPAVATVVAPPVAAPVVPPAPPVPPVPSVPPGQAPAFSVPQAQPAVPTGPPAPQPPAEANPSTVASVPAKPSPARKAAVSAPKPAAPPPKAEPVAPPARVPALAELPVELRQQVPTLVVGGSVYSPQASVRMVVINGQVFQEGNSLGPELKLEQVRPKTAVFSIRGQRFELPL